MTPEQATLLRKSKSSVEAARLLSAEGFYEFSVCGKEPLDFIHSRTAVFPPTIISKFHAKHGPPSWGGDLG